MSSQRQRAIRKRRIFIVCFILILLLIAAGIFAVIKAVKKADDKKTLSSSSNVTSSAPVEKKSAAFADTPDMVTRGEYTLDANYKRLILVNDANPLPDDYDYTGNLTEIPDEYHNGQLNQIDKEVWPYMKAMVEAAWKDGVKLYVWSPYRSYNTQQMLFTNQINRQIANGVPENEADAKAATIVARPGTSEHHTGLAADFNMADDKFEKTEMYAWMQKNAADYGFIMRYPADKTDITGVIYESWHYRFVGINVAKEIKESGMAFEEYIESNGIKND